MPVTKRTQSKLRKCIALFLLFNLLSQLFAPSVALALTAGPTAPEATNFEPVDTTDMVNPLTGSLTYNLPLIEVPGPEGGYPLSLSYHAGIQPNEEASWVGLGWALNPGAIARNVNGYPDDWSAVLGTERDYWNGGHTETIGLDFGIVEGPANVAFGLAFSQDTYKGFGVGASINLDLGINNSPFKIGVAVGVSPYGDNYAAAGLDYGHSIEGLKGLGLSAGLGLSTNFNSVAASFHENLSDDDKNSLGFSIGSSGIKGSLKVHGGEINAVNNANASKVSTSQASINIPTPLPFLSIGFSYLRYWSDETTAFTANGVLHSRTSIAAPSDLNTSGDDNYLLMDPINSNIVDNPDPIEQLGGTYPDFDNYSVTAQGLGGDIRPYVFSAVLYTQNRVNNSNHINDSYGLSLPASAAPNTAWQFRFINDLSNTYQQGHPWSTDLNYNFDGTPVYGNNDSDYGYDAATNRLEGSKHIEYFTNDEIADTDPNSKAHRMGFIDCQAAGFTRQTTISGNAQVGSQIGGFMITNSSGVTYHYALPAYSANELVHTELIDHTTGTRYNDLHKNTAYAYTWYLTAITGPDYVSRGATKGVLDPGDWGYWVKLDYGKWAGSYPWRNPSEGFHIDLDNTFQNYSAGTKELYYLDAIETRTHTALFVKDLRTDAKSMNSAGTGFDDTSVSSLELNQILLLKNDQLTTPINQIRNTGNLISPGANFSNVVDVDDIRLAAEQLTAKCLRKILFTFNNSLCPGVPNSFVSGSNTTNLGKLTLLSVDFQGKGGAAMTPPLQFQYDLDPSDPANQESITIVSAPFANTNQKGSVQLDNSGKFKMGDIISFPFSGVTYYCTLASTPDISNTCQVVFLNNSPGTSANGQTAAAVKTKNPPYNRDANDNWGCYKSDYIASPSGNDNLSRFTTKVSGAAADVWSLRKIVSSIGANINMDYEGNTYNKSVLNENRSLVITGPVTRNSTRNYTFSVNNEGLDLSTIYKPGDRLHGIFLKYVYSDKFYSDDVIIENGYTAINSDSYLSPMIINSISGNMFTVTVDPQMETDMTSIAGFGIYGTANTTQAGDPSIHAEIDAGNILANGYSLFYGGGVRVKDIVTDDLSGQINQTVYNYGAFGYPQGQASSSGVTAFEPLVFDMININWSTTSASKITAPNFDAPNVLKRELYKQNNNLLSIARELPSPGVMYESVAVTDNILSPNGAPVQIEGTTVYQYEVFKREMVGLFDYNDEEPVPANQAGPNLAGNVILSQITGQAKKDRTIKDYTSRIGNLKRVITYDNSGNKLSEKINHYLHDDLDNTSLENQVAGYESRLSAYNNIGVLKERYGNARLLVRNTQFDPFQGTFTYQVQSAVMLSNRETFPTIQIGTTQIDYKNGTRMDQSNLAFDFYTGAVTSTLTTDSYGNRFINEITPAYAAVSNSSPAYPGMGLRTHDDDPSAVQHKQMLTQQASSYTYAADGNNNKTGVVAASVQTWSNAIPAIDQDGNLTTTGQAGIWRMDGTYMWVPPGTSPNNVSPYSSFVNYYLGSSPSWKKTAQVTQYNVYSEALEATDINTNYAATRMGYNNSKVLLTGGPAQYKEIAYAGAEDPLLGTGLFSSNVSPGGGAVVVDSTQAHTGISSLSVPSGLQGFSYTLSGPGAKNYSVSVWVKPTPGNQVQAQLYYAVNNGTAVAPAQTLAKSAAGWYLLEMTVPSTALSSATTLLVGCKNTSAASLYFDDFRFQPTSAATTAYIYDTQTGELSYTLGNNNLFVRYQYDAIGRLVRTYKEVLGKTIVPIAQSLVYNYGRNNAANWENTGNTRCQQVNGYNDGYLDAEQKDISSHSPTNNQSRWVATTNTSASCPNQLVAFTLTNNSTGSSFNAVFSGIASPFSFPGPGHSVTVLVPVGSYTVQISPTGPPDANTYNYSYGLEHRANVNNATFSDVVASLNGGYATTLTVQ